MSFIEFFGVVFVFLFLLKEKDIKKITQICKQLGKYVKKAKKTREEINLFLEKTTNLSTNKKDRSKKKISFVENDFTKKLIIPTQNQQKPYKKKLSTKQTKQT